MAQAEVAAQAVTSARLHGVLLEAIADTLEKAPRMTDGDLKYIVVDDALASQWARGIRGAMKASTTE
jgi:hypothetical protein